MKNTYIKLHIPYKFSEQIEEVLNANEIYQYSIDFPVNNVMDYDDAYREEIRENSCVTIVVAERLESKIIEQIQDIIGVEHVQVEEEQGDDDTYKNAHKHFFDTIIVNDAIAIVPEWISEKLSQQFTIRINPGYSFGTGIHATTRDCIQLLSKVTHKGDRILDAGAGSGILTIASSLFGASHVTSVEIDQNCLEAIQGNLHINGLDNENINIIIGNILLESIDYKNFDVIVLNIGPMIATEFLKRYGTAIPHATRIIVSGLTPWSKRQVDDAITLCQRQIIETHSADGEWITYLI